MKIIWKDPEKKRDDFASLIPCIEKAYAVKFPEDFKQCVIEYGGASPDPYQFDTEHEKGKRFEKLFSLNPRSDFFFRYFVNSISFRAPDTYPIAYDSLHNFICLDYRKGSTPIVTYEKNDPSLTGEEKGDYICNSFTELLEMLY